jgi:hypothetical protein
MLPQYQYSKHCGTILAHAGSMAAILSIFSAISNAVSYSATSSFFEPHVCIFTWSNFVAVTMNYFRGGDDFAVVSRDARAVHRGG